MRKKIAILGATGSIGVQALEIVEQYRENFEIVALSAKDNYQLLAAQALRFSPLFVCLENEKYLPALKEKLAQTQIKILQGRSGLQEICTFNGLDLVLNALVGAAGLSPSFWTLEAGKKLALANKESLVIAGDHLMALAKSKNTKILPVDSEHSALAQCLVGESYSNIRKMYLTASGGPFRGKSITYLENITPKQALLHPTWQMGKKISIDSATLINKGFEVIEAHFLFELPAEKIEVLIHPQSIIHSMVSFCDGSIKAQMSIPTMHIPIQYALFEGERKFNIFEGFDWDHFAHLDFEKPDLITFYNLALAYEVLKKKGNAGAILNAANEVAVALFLEEKIDFLAIGQLNAYALEHIDFIAAPSFEQLITTDLFCKEKIAKDYESILEKLK